MAPVTTRADPALVKALARAFRYQRMLDEGRYGSVTEMAAAEEIGRGYLGRLLQLTLLAPHIIEAILDGRLPYTIALPAMLGPDRRTGQSSWSVWRIGSGFWVCDDCFALSLYLNAQPAVSGKRTSDAGRDQLDRLEHGGARLLRQGRHAARSGVSRDR
jgi:hypothetical protein